MDEIKEKTKELAEALVRSQEYQNFLQAKKGTEGSAAASKMLNDFMKMQSELQSAQMRGEDVSKERIEQLQRSFEIISFNPYIRDYFAADLKLLNLLSQIMMELGMAVGIDPSHFSPPQGPEE